jgi:hypothetical protein
MAGGATLPTASFGGGVHQFEGRGSGFVKGLISPIRVPYRIFDKSDREGDIPRGMSPSRFILINCLSSGPVLPLTGARYRRAIFDAVVERLPSLKVHHVAAAPEKRLQVITRRMCAATCHQTRSGGIENQTISPHTRTSKEFHIRPRNPRSVSRRIRTVSLSETRNRVFLRSSRRTTYTQRFR